MGIINELKGLSVVFPVIISTVASIMSSGVTYNMLVQKSCCPDGPPEDLNKFICSDKGIIENIVEILSTQSVIKAVFTAMCGFLFGFLRDLTGRSKILMYVGVTGELISVGASFASAYFWNSSPWILVLIQAIAAGGFGESIMQMGGTCILMAESSQEELPLRIQLFMIGTLMTALIGGLLTTLLVTSFGYLWLFTFCVCLQVLALFLLIVVIKNKGYDRKTLKESVQLVKKVFRRRENGTVLWLMLIALATAPTILTNEAIQGGKFLQIQFHYSLYQGQVFSIFSFFIAIVGSTVVPMILRKFLHCKELTIGIVVCLACAAATFMFAFVDNEVFLYFCGLAYFLKLACLPLPNTVISTIVDSDELGTYLGINAILTTCIPLGITKLYQEVASQYLETWIGAFYFVSSGCFLFLTLIYSVSYCLYVEPKKPESTVSKEDLGLSEEDIRI
ncbi:uncharacterized protein [Halyomorpha halys]|uniref:uncharacterized protein n=1 Tax=Halyomorpha halys TaxID=286706 RepID=UPI0006D4D5D2|nr:uncharacterized protein LOC106690977 [Halyomorpha halys]